MAPDAVTSNALIEVRNLDKHYGRVPALVDVSLQVAEGEFIAFLGPSGCGKTTLLRIIAGFVEPTRGSVWIGGKDMTYAPPNRRPVNTVFQNYALFPHLTVAANVGFGPRRNGADRRRLPALVEKALALVGMEGFGPRYPAELSGGQQQRVALARALINRPRALLLDEPLAALDLKLRRRMQLELRHLHRNLGTTFLFVTHDQEEAISMADRIAVMQGGRIVQFGTGEEIYRRPNSRYVADFIGEANLLECRVGEGGMLYLADDGPSIPYRAPENADDAPTLLVRPEHIALGARNEEACVTLQVRVRETIFVGGALRVHAVLSSEQELVFLPASGARAMQIQPGDVVDVHWHIDDATVLSQ